MNNCRIINAEIGLGYGVFSFIGCGIICLLSKDKNKSDLIYAEMLQWLLDTCVSFNCWYCTHFHAYKITT